MSEKKRNSPLLHIATPFIVLALCAGIVTAALIKPSDKLKMYLNIAFMDSLRSEPDGGGSGLVVKDNDIIEDYSGKTSSQGEVIRPKFGELFAVLKCDALEVDVPVYWGSGSELLELGACQSTGSAVPGTEGNAVISAHVDTFFADLGKLDIGDKVTLDTNYGQFIYTVKELIEFKATNGKYVVPTEDTRLTLYTCKKDILGNSDQRFGVICELTESRFYTEAGGEDQ
ncbi:MAG: class D sortase [Ruminococcus sp.]|nr:class D sortase [Ruminococcus sp.]